MNGSASESANSRAAIRTFLIADIRGYTGFTAEHGDEAASRLTAKFAEVAGEGIEAWGGSLIELRGDEALAAFDSARQALRCAGELQAAFTSETRADPTLPLLVGIGLEAGEAVAVGDGFRGAALNLAARLCAAAATGEIIATRNLAQLAGPVPGFTYVDLAPSELKGLRGPVGAVRVESAEPGGISRDERTPRPPAPAQHPQPPLPSDLDPIVPLAGRTAELRWLAWHWRRAGHSDGRAVVISGPPGMGKTRLAAELASRVHAEGATVLYLPAARAIDAVEVESLSVDAEHTLVIVDDLDAAPSDLVRAVAEIAERLAGTRTLLLVNHREAAAPALVARAKRLASVERRRPLGPLEPEALRAIAALYGGPAAAEFPLSKALAETGGLPAAVHRWSSAWARERAGERLGASVGRTSAGRHGLRAAEAELVADVAALELARERTDLYGADRVTDGVAVARARADVCPYKGLAAFEAADAEYYFGRERLVAELVTRLVGSVFLGLVGASGSGKSSALRAGLLAALAGGVLPGSNRWRQILMRPGEHPVAELGRALARRQHDDALAADPRALLETAIASLPGGTRLVLVVDQFEEVFNATRDEGERAAFIELLTTEREGLQVIVALRADHYGQCAAYPGLARLLASNQVLVGPLTRIELTSVIEHPAQRVGLRIEAGLADALLADVGDEPGALPLLSTALLELWQAREGGRLTLAAYRASGGVHGAVARLAEDAYGKLDSDRQAIVRSLFLRLSGPGEGEGVVRRRVPLAEFDTRREPQVLTVIEALTNARLLTSGDGFVEVAHEALLREWPRVQRWLEEDAAGRQLRLHLIDAARDWDTRGREAGDLYRGARLAAALDWAADHEADPNALERDFLAESRVASEREAERQRRANRRLRVLLAGAAAFLVLAVGAGGFAAYQAQVARQAEDFARSRELAASAIGVLDDDPTLSKLLAISAASIANPPVESVAALHRAWDADRVVYRYQWPADRPVSNLITDLDPSGRYLVASGFLFDAPHDYLEVVDRQTHQTLWSFEPKDDNLAVGNGVFTPDGSRIVFGVYREQAPPGQTGSAIGEVGIHVRDTRTGEEIELLDIGPCGGAVTGASVRNVMVMTSSAPSCITWRGASDRRDIALEIVEFGSSRPTVLTPGDGVRGVRPSDEGALSEDGRIAAFNEDAFSEETGRQFVSVVADVDSGSRFDVDLQDAFAHDVDQFGSRVLWDHDGRLKVWDVASREVTADLPGNAFYAQFGPLGRGIFGTGDDGMVRQWDSETGEEIFAYPAPQGRPSATAGEGLVLVPALGTPTALLIDTTLRAELGAASVGCGPAERPLSVSTRYLAVETFCGPTATTSLLDAKTLEVVGERTGGFGMALSADGTRLARQKAHADGDDVLVGPIEIVDLASAQTLELEGLCTYDTSREHTVHVPADNEGCAPFPDLPFPILDWQLRWSPDGEMIAVVDGLDGYFAVWDARDGRLIRQSLSASQGRADELAVFDVAFSADSRHLFVSRTTGRRTAPGSLESISTATWTIERGRQLALPGLRLELAGVSSDGSTLIGVSGYRDVGERALYWFDTRTLEDARPSRPRLHEGSLLAVAMGSDRSLLATGSSDGLVRVWDVATGHLEHEIPFAGRQVDGLAFVTDRHLGVVLDDGSFHLVTIDSVELLDLVRASLTRGFTEAECERYNFDVCPTLEDMAGPAEAAPSATATPVATAASSPLEGIWVTAPTTCGQQNAALAKAGFTAEQLELGGWDEATCMDMAFGSMFEVRFHSGRLVQFSDGALGWDGYYEVVDYTTIRAGDGGRDPYITYTYAIDGDRLVIDVAEDGFPGMSEAELWGDRIAQTVIYESAPFTR